MRKKDNIEIRIDGPVPGQSHPVIVALMVLVILGVVAAAVWFFAFSEWGILWSGNEARQRVEAPEDVVTSYPVVVLSLQQVSLMLEVGETSRLKPEIQVDRKSPVGKVRLNWVSQNPNVAKVDQHGLVTALGTGTATIAVTVANQNVNSNPAYCIVTVRNWSNTPPTSRDSSAVDSDPDPTDFDEGYVLPDDYE